MADNSFGTGWPACNRANIVTLVRNDGLRMPLHRDLVPLAAICFDVIEALGYDIRPDASWGYACRAIAGTRKASEHSYGTATDINAPSNPRRADRRFQSDIPANVIKFMEGVGWTWGGRWSWPDPMHFEWRGTAAGARRAADDLRRFFDAKGGRTPARPHFVNNRRPRAPRPYPGVVRMGSTGRAVGAWQQVLVDRGYRIAVDGHFGPRTKHVVADWQRKHGLKVDGVAGPATWHSLLFS